jgi:arginyl-tRNA synthetase
VPPALVDDLVRTAASEVLIARGLDPSALPVDTWVGRPHAPAQGEYATTVALRTAARAGVAPRELAGWLRDALVERPEFADVEVAGPGFLNLWMTPAGRAAVVEEALATEPVSVAQVEVAVRADLVETIGQDAARYAAVRPIDPALLTRRVLANPLFRVQYAHARLVALARNAADLGVEAVPGPLDRPEEIELVRCLAGFPAVVRGGAPHRVARCLEALADAVLDLHDSCAVLLKGDEEVTELHRARLAAAVAARRVLAAGLALLGVSAPDRI